jgi:plastocyanin
MRLFRAIGTVVVVVAAGITAGAQGAALTGVVRDGGRPIRDAVVWITDPLPAAASATARRAVLDQRNLEFLPRLLVVPVGTAVEMPNNDRLFHNVFSFHNGKRFDLGMYPAGTSKTVTFDQPGVSRVFCNIHPTMAAYVVAVPSTRFAVTDAAGRFAIRDLPPGTYGYSVWRAGHEAQTGTATVAGQPVTLDWR